MTVQHPVKVLCDTHTIPNVMFLRDNGPSLRTEIYRGVGRSTNMPRKLDQLETAGLIHQDSGGRGISVSLTPLGEDVANRIDEIDAVMSGQ